MPKDRGEEKVETGEKVTIKAELFDEVLKDYRGPNGTDAWDKEKTDPNGKPQKAPSLPQTLHAVTGVVVADDVLFGVIVLAHDEQFLHVEPPDRWSSLMLASASVWEL
ncbi:MAG: hypothetical protein ND866_19955 [Pyrinomonadaceae bacterium]|nr:hypothetical protein [Pyrinomonadaceae bacterium]